MKTRLAISVSLLLLALPITSMAEDWPQWRGPQRNGKSDETGLQQEWPAQGPKLLWQLKNIGSGYSTPAVVGNALYVISNEGMENEFLQAIDVETQEQLWSTRLGNVGPNQRQNYPGSRSTPTVDGNLIYALGSDGDLVCVEAANGEAVWKKSLRTDFGGSPGNWAYSESPLVDGDVVVCTPGGSQATIVALNKKTGEVVWTSPIAEGDNAAYSSAMVVEVGGMKQYVQFLEGGLVGVNAENGKFLWRYNETAQGSPANIPTPVVEGEFVYSSTSRGGGGLIKLAVTDEQANVEQVYFERKLPTAIGGAVLVDGHLYGATREAMLCADFKTGEVKWEARGIGAASVCYADGRLYLHGENGDVALIEPTADEYRERGRFTPPDQPERGESRAWAYPVVANGRLYIRDQGSLWCYDISAGE